MIVAILLATLVSLMVLRPIIPSAVDRVILRIPFYRDLVLAKQNYIVFFGLGILLAAGLRLEECLRLSRDNAPRGELPDDLERARKTIVGGSVNPWPLETNIPEPSWFVNCGTRDGRTVEFYLPESAFPNVHPEELGLTKR